MTTPDALAELRNEDGQECGRHRLMTCIKSPCPTSLQAAFKFGRIYIQNILTHTLSAALYNLTCNLLVVCTSMLVDCFHVA